MTDLFQPADEFIIEDLDTLKVIADPLRIDIMETVGQQARPAKDIAAELGREPSKLYYHINLLEKHQLIRVVETRIVSGIIEKWYRVAAKSIRVAPHLLTPGEENDKGIEMFLSGIFDRTKSDLRHSLLSGVAKLEGEKEKRPLFVHLRPRLTAAQYQELKDKLEEILKTLGEKEDETTSDDKQIYGLTLALYPSLGPEENQE
ncbi:MAG: helix-turn-helix transcriptional regulator [Anaerolineales bacterium]|nr:helix-turn-helix transcriptional regulator [Anaerolineales bacterium]